MDTTTATTKEKNPSGAACGTQLFRRHSRSDAYNSIFVLLACLLARVAVEYINKIKKRKKKEEEKATMATKGSNENTRATATTH